MQAVLVILYVSTRNVPWSVCPYYLNKWSLYFKHSPVLGLNFALLRPVVG